MACESSTLSFIAYIDRYVRVYACDSNLNNIGLIK